MGCINIGACKVVIYKGDDNDFSISPAEFSFVIAQLRDMCSAGQSAKMAVKNQQKPVSPIVFELMAMTCAVAKVEIMGRLSCHVIHRWSHAGKSPWRLD